MGHMFLNRLLRLWHKITWHLHNADLTCLRKVACIAQAVSRRLPTASARVRSQVRLFGICGGQSGTGAGYIQVLRFSVPILIPSTALHSLITILPFDAVWFRYWQRREITNLKISVKCSVKISSETLTILTKVFMAFRCPSRQMPG
jgi:hypothetical protein